MAIPVPEAGPRFSVAENIRKSCFGSSPHTTNNRMELAGAIEGFRALKEPCEVEVVTDSEYVLKGITQWIENWKRRGWMTKAKKPVVNRDLWMTLDRLQSGHKVRWTWTRGHASHGDNNRADELATLAAASQTFSQDISLMYNSPAYDLRNAEPAAMDSLSRRVAHFESRDLRRHFRSDSLCASGDCARSRARVRDSRAFCSFPPRIRRTRPPRFRRPTRTATEWWNSPARVSRSSKHHASRPARRRAIRSIRSSA